MTITLGMLMSGITSAATFLAAVIALTWRFGQLVATLKQQVETLQSQLVSLQETHALAAKVPDLITRVSALESERAELRETITKLRIAAAAPRAHLPSVGDL